MLSPWLSLGRDLQCFTRDGTKIHRYTLSLVSGVSCATHDFEAVLRSDESFSTSQGSNHIRPVSVLFLTCLKICRIFLSMNLIHLITVSYHQVCLKSDYFAKFAHKIAKSKYFPNIFYDSDSPINSLSDNV